MAFQCFYIRGPKKSSRGSKDVQLHKNPSKIEEVNLNINWDDVTCPICLNHPHNGVLLQCSSHEQGCRPYVCDTNHSHSNCLERFKSAYGMPSKGKSSSTFNVVAAEDLGPVIAETNGKPSCPLCRGDVNSWVVTEKAREYLDQKRRCCEEDRCPFVGTYVELQKHAQEEHPNSRPSKIDPARQLDWENFQQSSEIVDVLSIIHSEVPSGVVLGDYVIEYDDYSVVDEFEDFPVDERNWWTSCVLYQVFDNFRSSRNRRRLRNGNSRRGSHHSSSDTSNSDDGSLTSVEFSDDRDATTDEFVNSRALARINVHRQSFQRRPSRFFDR